MTTKTCTNVIGFSDPYIKREHVNGGPRRGWYWVRVYKCKECESEFRLIENWRGPTPNGGVVCGRSK